MYVSTMLQCDLHYSIYITNHNLLNTTYSNPQITMQYILQKSKFCSTYCKTKLNSINDLHITWVVYSLVLPITTKDLQYSKLHNLCYNKSLAQTVLCTFFIFCRHFKQIICYCIYSYVISTITWQTMKFFHLFHSIRTWNISWEAAKPRQLLICGNPPLVLLL